ncbi:hypothetical protein SK128_002567 [Halocaridina rubra]|uniref:C-factor n=1 Tax=Halocaridina rubra TaxID=373956 RepID=A0AAN8XHV2_HALRR
MLSGKILITGSNRGLGLEFVNQLAKCNNSPEMIIATCRKPEEAMDLQTLANTHKNIHVTKLDVANEASYGSFVDHVKDLVGSTGINLLVNNAGYAPKSTRINMVKWEQMQETLLINTIAPLMITKALLPLLTAAASKSCIDGFSVNKAAVINMSSVLGSISANAQGGLYPYRASKAALNAITKSLSLDLQHQYILVASIHPGWVQTDMGGKNAPLTPQESISEIVKTLSKFNEEHNGGFYQYDGKQIQW